MNLQTFFIILYYEEVTHAYETICVSYLSTATTSDSIKAS